MSLRIGHGYDVHRLVEGRDLILGGVKISCEKGLLGHSDADVLLHAVMDAILGAMGEKDIGGLFPDNDPAYQDADSMKLTAEVGELMRKKGYIISNIDATVIAQAPKLSPHIGDMKENIAFALGTSIAQVNVKVKRS